MIRVVSCGSQAVYTEEGLQDHGFYLTLEKDDGEKTIVKFDESQAKKFLAFAEWDVGIHPPVPWKVPGPAPDDVVEAAGAFAAGDDEPVEPEGVGDYAVPPEGGMPQMFDSFSEVDKGIPTDDDFEDQVVGLGDR